MPRIKSAKKRVEVAERNRLRNMAYKSSVKTAIKKVITALAQNEQADALTAALNAAYAKIDKAVTKNILHRNTAARYKSRIALKVNKVLKPAA